MMTFSDKQAMERAYKKACEVKPKARELSFGVYSVTGSKGDTYTVTFKKLDGQLQSECTCKAHVASAQPKMCFHIMSVTGHYKMRVREASEARKAANFAASICGDCGGLRGSELADDDHRTCTCSGYATPACKDCGKETTDLDSTGRCSACIAVELFG